MRAACTYRLVAEEELTPALFSGFDRTQEVTQCWRRVGGVWRILPIAFVEQWGAEDYAALCRELSDICARGGQVWGAFAPGLVGFAAVRRARFGSRAQYVQLAELYVSRPWRGRGVGRELFARAVCTARDFGAQSLYISAHSAQETQAFYARMRCLEAAEPDPTLSAAEPCDCQLEFPLGAAEKQRF